MSGNLCTGDERDRANYVTESDSEDSGGSNRKSNSPLKESSGQSRTSSGASRQERRAKSRSPRKASIAADSPTNSPSKVVITTRASKSNFGIPFAEAKPVFPHHSVESPRYSPSPAQPQSINNSIRGRNGPPHIPSNANSKPNESRRPFTYKVYSSRTSPRTIPSLHLNQSPQMIPNALNALGNHCPSASPSSGFPMPSKSHAIVRSLEGSPSGNSFRPVGEVAHHPNPPVPSIPNPIQASSARHASERPSRHGGPVTHQSPPNPWTVHRHSDNPFASFPKTKIHDMPIVPGPMAPRPPLAGTPSETPPIFPPSSQDQPPSPATHETRTRSERKLPTKKANTNTRYFIDKDLEPRKKSKQIGTVKKAIQSPTTTQSVPRARRPEHRQRCPRPPPAIDAPSHNTRARAMERKRLGQGPLVGGARFGYEALEAVEKQARKVNKVRRERQRVGSERREGVGWG